jgi:hypothetical protein
MSDLIQCACPSCHCQFSREKAVVCNGKLYCSKACAYECTETTCLCIHERCDDEQHPRH